MLNIFISLQKKYFENITVMLKIKSGMYLAFIESENVFRLKTYLNYRSYRKFDR